jgi:hypothetical protein
MRFPGKFKIVAAAASVNKAGPQLDKVKSVGEVEQYRCGEHKISICHVPPGNSAQRHTLCVGAPAIAAHLKHHKAHDSQIGDYVGECVADGGGDSGGGDNGGSTGGEATDDGGGTTTPPADDGGGEATDSGGTTTPPFIGNDLNDPWYMAL